MTDEDIEKQSEEYGYAEAQKLLEMNENHHTHFTFSRADISKAFQDGAKWGIAEGRKEVREHETTCVNRLRHIEKELAKSKEQIEKMKAELHHRLVSPSHDDRDCLAKIVGLDHLWQFGQEF